jgi:hypothetical protein
MTETREREVMFSAVSFLAAAPRGKAKSVGDTYYKFMECLFPEYVADRDRFVKDKKDILNRAVDKPVRVRRIGRPRGPVFRSPVRRRPKE